MKHVILILTVVLAALATPASPTLATDLCIDLPDVPVHIVGKAFLIPRKNTCKPFMGFLNDVGDGGMVAGAACTSANGQLLRLHFTGHGADVNFFDSFECDFLLPSLTDGNCQNKFISNTNVVQSISVSATAARCTESTP